MDEAASAVPSRYLWPHIMVLNQALCHPHSERELED